MEKRTITPQEAIQGIIWASLGTFLTQKGQSRSEMNEKIFSDFPIEAGG